MGGNLGSVVLSQQAAWAALMLALAATAQTVTRSAYSLGPIILLAMYPGLLNFRNIIAPVGGCRDYNGRFGGLLQMAGNSCPDSRHVTRSVGRLAVYASSVCSDRAVMRRCTGSRFTHSSRRLNFHEPRSGDQGYSPVKQSMPVTKELRDPTLFRCWLSQRNVSPGLP
jgi:hypothetical protein